MSKFYFFPLLILLSCGQTPKTENGEPMETKKLCVLLSETETKGGLVYFNNSPISEILCSYFPNGNLHTETNFENGVKEGAWKVYFENGNLAKSGSLQHGLDEGQYLEYYESGQLKYDYHYRKGEKTGIWKSWYTDGNKYTERHFTNNMLHGKVLVWDEKGRLAKEYDYLHGKLVNQQMHFEKFED